MHDNRLNTMVCFAKRFLRNPASIGSVVPSSIYLARFVARHVVDQRQDNDYIVELGSGTGALTAALLKNGVQPERLICVDNDTYMLDRLKQRFPDVQTINANACFLHHHLHHVRGKVGCVVSGLPLRNFSDIVVEKIIQESFEAMHTGGIFYQFTYGLTSPIKRHDLLMTKLGHVWRNVPPATVWSYRRHDDC